MSLMENKEEIEINGKVILYGIIIALILLLVLMVFGVVKINLPGSSIGNVVSGNGDYSNIPEKCRPQTGYDIDSWKEHLGHHAETQECLKYFD